MSSVSKKNPRKYILGRFLLVIIIFLITAIAYIILNSKPSQLPSDVCQNEDLGVTLKLPDKSWSCHNDNGYFYVQPPWVEVRPNTGSSPQYNISFSKLKDNPTDIIDDSRFCAPNEYSSTNKKCLELQFYSHDGFEIFKHINQKNKDLGTSVEYVGVLDDFLEVQFHPSSSQYVLTPQDVDSFNKLFDSIKRI